ncbi:uncharacterized protein TNIN_264981 [Trichonephila inaurata madagascariensis]|uniref:Uncharacterized protein n=1 Tax=Trichonephila inaurata madagascariensis TaxID=2747483 RepID=A0A8X7BRY2_9ARAC|nr:uncharacterized protein TNIN_264981 [Trichonephila inaurata madagascariensis]
MPFFLKPCLKIRKKKKNKKVKSTTYFKSYLDKESPIQSELTLASTSNSAASSEIKENGCSIEAKLEIAESHSEHEERRETEESDDEAHSSERDILDILDSAVEQLSDERSISDEDNRYCIMSSSSRFDEANGDIQLKRLLTQSVDNLETMVNGGNKELFLNNREKEMNGSLITASNRAEESKTSENNYMKAVPVEMKDILKGTDGSNVNIIKLKPKEVCNANITDLVCLPQQVTEIKCQEPTAVKECSIKNNLSRYITNPSVEKYYQSSETGNYALENFEKLDSSIANNSELWKKGYFKSNTSIDAENEIPDTITSDNIIDSNKECNINSYQFFDSELSKALERSLGIEHVTFNIESSDKDEEKLFPGDSIKYYSDSSCLEKTSMQNKKQDIIMNPSENIKLRVGDNICDSLTKKEINDDIKIKVDSLINNQIQNDVNTKLEQSSILVECSGDHIVNLPDLPDKQISCRLAENIAQNQSLNPVTDYVDLNGEQKERSNNRKSNLHSKRRRSRNVLLNSLSIKLSPEDERHQVHPIGQHNPPYISSEECIQKSCETNQIHNCTSSKFKIKSNDSMKEEIVEHAFVCEDGPFKIEETDLNIKCKNEFYANEREIMAPILKEKFRNIKNSFSNNNLFLNENQTNEFDETVDKNLMETRNNSFLQKNIELSTQLTHGEELQLCEMIKKLIKFVRVEVTQYIQLNSVKSYSLKNFMEELLFDYAFYKDGIDDGVLENGKQFTNEFLNGDEINIQGNCESNIKIKEIENPFHLEITIPPIFTKDNDMHQNSEYMDNVCQYNNVENFQYYDTLAYTDSELPWLDTNCCDSEQQINASNLQSKGSSLSRTFNDNQELVQNENIIDESLLSTLDESLAMEELLKSEIKKQGVQSNSLILRKDLENEVSIDISEKRESCLKNENLMVYKMECHEDRNIPSSLNDSQYFIYEEMDSFAKCENNKILRSPASSEGGDIGDKGNESYQYPKNLLTETSLSYCERCSEEDDDDDINIPDKMPFSNFTKQNAERNNLNRQDIQNDLTFILSPRKENAPIQCNMTVSKDKEGNPSYVLSPISVQVTRKDIERKEHGFPKKREATSKTSVEELLETYRRHRLYLAEMKKVEEQRLRNLELYNHYKDEALKPMKQHTRIIPIQPSQSFEFTLSGLDDTPKHSKKRQIKSKKSIAQTYISPRRARKCILSSPSTDRDFTSYPSSLGSSVHDLDIIEAKSPKGNQISRKKDNYVFSPKPNIYDSPIRKRILTESKAIRSPKYPMRVGQTSSKEMLGHKVSPHKIIVNRPKVYFVRRSPSGHIKKEKGVRCSIENSKSMEDYRRYFTSPNSDYMASDELNSKFDRKFRRYAKRGRITGDLISYRRSTEWLKDAGIVGKVMTAQEADKAFKCAAGSSFPGKSGKLKPLSLSPPSNYWYRDNRPDDYLKGNGYAITWCLRVKP